MAHNRKKVVTGSHPAASRNILGSFLKMQGQTPPWRLRVAGMEVDLAFAGLKALGADS